MSKILLSLCVFFLFQKSNAQTFNGTGGTIPDGGPQACFNITVSGVGAINGTYGVASVCLNITHPWVSDLEINLTAPDGTIIPLSIQNGGSGVNYTNTCFTESAATSITTGTAPFTGNYNPEGNLGSVNNGQNANGVWQLCIEDVSGLDAGSLANWSILFNNTPAPPPVAPTNDNPCNATPLTVSVGCNYTTYTTENATNSPGVPAPGCSNYAGGDVWFSVTVPAAGSLIFDTQTGVVTDGGMAIYSGTCNALTLIDCDDDLSNNGLMPMISATGLTPGSTVWIRFWEYANDNPGTFGICVTTPPPPPTNDEACTAYTLPVNNSCTYTTYTNVGSTTSSVPDPGCGDFQGNDVWFSVTVPAGGSLIFDSNTGTMTDADMAVYSGTCNGLTLLACDDLSSTNGFMPSITLSGLTPGATLWIRIWEFGNDNPGTFQLCASIPPPPTVQDCPAALAICQNVYNQPTAYSGTGSLPNEIDENISCLEDGERADVWYTFTVQSSGNLNFTLTPNNITEDYDWAVYNLTGATCSDIYSNAALNVSCNFSSTSGSTGPTGGSALNNQDALGTPFNATIPVVAGQTYVINVSNYSLSTNGYSIDFSASTASIFDNIAPQIQSMGSTASCGGNQIAINFSENILCNTIQNTDFTITGPGGPYTVTGWSSVTCASGATYANNVVLTVSPALSTNGNYQVCLTNASGSVTDLCGNVAPPGCLNFTIATTIPTFNPVGPICSGSAAPVLPTTSNNGITGTWSPATVSNTATGTYTFSPSTGQCATVATLTVTVTGAGTVPTFNAVPAFCQGTTAPVLPTTSTNGITGTWSPATVNNMASASYTFTPGAGQCATLTTITVTVTSNTTPTFTAIPAFCSGATAPVLPTTSNNGISGTWAPATVSNTATGTYTFTPNAGQCASTTTLTVTVNNSITPTFAFATAICNGAAAPALPNTSTNGITGTWSPATISNTATGTYTFTPNAGQCAATTSVTVTVYELPVLYVSGTNPSCTGTCDGSATVTVSGGTAPYIYSWSNSGSTPTITNLCAGTYSVTVTDSHGCVSAAVSPATSGCFQIQSTMVDACSAIEYDQEMTFFQVGSNPLNTSSLTVSWPTAANSWNGLCSNPAFIASVNATITGGGVVLPLPVSGILPANANVVLITSTPATSASSFANLTDTLYAMFQCPGNTNGHFSNNTGLPGIRTLIMNFGAGCTDTTTYDPSLLINQNGTTGGNAAINNGAYVLYSANGTPTYYNFGCTIPNTILSTQVILVAPPQVTPTFIQVGPYCQNAAAPALPGISNNGIAGTWSPATINTSTAGTSTYTFTPNAGQCATTATMNITVAAIVTSTTNITICSDQLPYSWNSQTYNAAGTFNLTLTSSAGCDSIATLNLTVNPVVTSTTNTTICSNQLPYSWNSQTYNAGGTYNVTLTSSAGCDSIATLNLTVNPVVTSTTNMTICSNQLPYSWNSQTYNAGGTYTVTLTSNAGCDSIATLNLTINGVVTSTTNTTICSNQLPYSWNSQTYNAAGTFNVTLTSSAGCDSIATLNLTVNPVVTSTINTTICSNQLPYTWNSQTYNAAGTFNVTLISSAGCDSIATLNLIVNPVVTSTTNTTICSNQLPYSWNSQTYNAAGTFNVTLTSSAGCDSIATLNLTVNPIVTSTTNTTICSNQLPYSWNSQTYNAGGTYNVTLTSSAGCDSIATLNLTVNPVVTSTTNTTICSNQLPYSWNSQTYNAAGTFNVTLTSSAGCDSIATLNLTVNPIVTSTTNTTICSNQLPYSWNSQTYNAGGTYNVTLTSSAGCDSIATLNLTINGVVTSTTNTTICSNQLPYSWNSQTYNAGGTYNVTLTSSAGCDSIATLILTVNTVVTSTTNTTICSNQLPYSWNSQTYNAAGTFNITLTSSAGCDSIATLILTVNTVVTSTTNTTICSNQLPYSWNSQTYNAAGTFNITLTSSAGCDSIATLILTANPVVTSTTNTTICSNQLPYSWNSQTYNAGGTYNVTLTSSAGCDSIATLNLTVNSIVTNTTNTTICSNQLPYTWNSQTYNTAGTFNVTLTSSAGCDSIATLNLTVNPVVTSTTNTTICSNQLPYLWNSQTYNTAGTFNVTLTSSAGCDSIATLNLTVSPVVTSITNITICSNQLPYSWNSQTYNAAGTFNVNLTSSAGCDSIATLNLIVNPVVTSTTNTTICSNQLPYSWNSQTYNSAGTFNVTLTSSVGCDSIATLNLIVNPVVTSTTNTTICSNQLPYSWNSQTYNSAGTFNVTLTSSVGCDSIATLNLIVNPVVTSTTNTTICSNQLPYSWNSQTYNSAGTFNVTLTSSTGCDSIATLNLTVNPVVTSTTDVTICTNQLPYSWNSQTYNAAGTFNVTLTSTSGCDSIATLNLTVNPAVTSTTNTTICSNQLPYSWNSQTYNAGGTYTVTLTSNAGCDSIATLNLTINGVVTSTTNTTICSNQLPYSWNSQTYNAAGTFNVTLTSSAGCDSIATLNLTVNPVLTSITNITICSNQLPYSWNSQTFNAAGTYNVTLTSSAGCDSIATLNLTVNPVVTSTTNITICSNQLPYSWNSQTYNAAGTFNVTLTSSAGCDSIATLNLTVNNTLTSTTDVTICSNQLPYSWNSQTYNAAGTFNVTLTSSAGCDSITTLNLTVNSVLTSTTDVTICSNQLPYSWNSQTYNAAGTFNVTLTSTSGCDSIATLNLTVNSILTSTTDVTICSNQLPYSWNSQTYNAAGTFNVTLTSSTGCDSIATLNLTVNNTLTSTTNVTICTNQLPYSWNSQTYNAAGTFNVTLTSTAGCDSIATLNLTVNPVLTSTTNVTICSNQLPYSWNSQTYNAAGTFNATLTSSAGCDSIATLNLTVNSVLTSTTDVTICSNQLPYSWNSQTYNAAGTFNVTLTSSAGCDSIATLNLTVNNTLTSTTDVTICSNQLPYSWNSQTYNASGTFNVTLTSTSGCDSITTLNLTVNSVLTSTTDVTICSNQLPYSWNSQTYNAAGTFNVTLTSTAGCDSIATLNLTVNSVLTSITDITICSNQLPYSWNSQTYNTAGTFNVTLTSSAGCDSIATLNLTVNSVLTSTTDITICSNQLPYSWNSQTYNTAGTFNVTLTSSAGCDSVATLNLTVSNTLTSTTDVTICSNQLPYSWNSQTYNAAGTFNVTLTSSAGCDSVATLNLTVNNTLTSTTDVTICTNQLPYSWNSQTYNAAGTFIVTLTSSAGCDSIATLNLTVNNTLTSTTDVTICSNQLPYSWNSQTYNAGGTFNVTLTSTSGCDSIATLNLTVNSVLTSTTDITICSNQLPYTWNSQTYNAAGTFNVTLTSSAGCDSIATLNLTVNSILTSSTDVTICTNQLPYSWNSQTYNAAGTYNVTLTSTAGCDSIATLNLTVNSVLTSTTDVTICSNQLPYSWNSQTYNAAGTFNVTLTSTSGCDSIATLNLTVNSILTSTTNTTICSNQVPYTWNSQTYNAGGTYNVTLTSTSGCDSIATLNLTINNTLTSTTDVTICTNQLPYSWNSQTYNAAGTFNVTLTSSAGCDSIATLNLTVNNTLTSTTNVTICSTQLPYTWNSQTYNAAGTFNVNLTSTAGCDSIATLNLTVNNTLTSTTDLTICSNQLPYSWNSQTYNAAGIFNVTLTSTSGCDSIATLNLTVNSVLTSTTDVTICSNQLPYSWNSQTYSAAGTFNVTLTSTSGCDSIATLNLTVNNTLTSTTDVTICSNQLPYSWNSQTYNAAGIFNVTLTSTSGCDSIATLNLTVNSILTSTTDVTICSNQLPYSWNSQTYSAAGTFNVTLTSTSGCDSIATLNLTVNNTLTSTTDVTICSNQLPYSWNSQTYNAAGTFNVTLTSSAGCDSIATLNLTVNNTLTSTTNVTICTNQLPYSWNSQTYNAAGAFNVTLTSSAGCDSIATLNLTVNNTLTSTTDLTICSNQLPYTWNSQTYNASGTFNVTLTSTAGCDSIATLNLTVNNTLTSTTDVTICSNQLPYTWNSQTYNAAGAFNVTLTSSAGCDSIATLNLTVNNTLTSTTYVTICSNQLPYNWNSQTYNAAGSFNVTLTSSAGCDSIATLNLTVNNTLTSTTDVTICSNHLPYSWNSQTYNAAGSFNVTLTSSTGCDSTATLNLTVNPVVTSNTNTTICSNQLPYSWNSQTYNAAGTFNVALTSSAGCDSIATLNLTVNNVLTSTTNVTICSNQLPYSWNSQTYNAGGTYNVTLTSSAGCDSIATLNLSVNSVVTSTTNTTICSNQIPYNWNGQVYNTAGTYNVTLTSSSGCDSIATLNLQVNNTSSSNTAVSVCSNQLPYTWNGNNYSGAGIYQVTLTGSNGCDSVATLQLNVNSVTTSSSNAVICSNQAPYNWNGNNYSTSGSYQVTLTGSNGCDSVATLVLTVNPVVTSSTNASTCSNQLPYTWNGQSYNQTGNYQVTLVSNAGCDSIATLHLLVNPVVSSSSNASTCSSQLPYLWNGLQLNTAGIHTITLTSNAGCDSIVTLNLTINQTPTAPVVATPVTYCQFSTASPLTANGTHTLLWYTNATGGTGTTTAPTPSTAAAGSVVYYVSQHTGFCESVRVPITVIVNPKPSLGADKDIRLCFGDSANMATQYNTFGLTANWTYNSNPISAPGWVHSSGNYQLTISNNFGCADTASIRLTIQPELIANAGADDIAEYGIPYQLQGSGGGQYLWSPGSPLLNNPYASSPNATLTEDTRFVLMVKDEIGCTDYDTVFLKVLKGPTFYIPNAFTPNGDGLNDTYKPTAVGIAKLEYFRIFNRYGELVFETHEINKGWDGNYKGIKQPLGGYVWMLKGVDRKGEVKVMKGNVVLVR